MLMYSSDLPDTSARPGTIQGGCLHENNKLHVLHISIVTSRKTVQDKYNRGSREREREKGGQGDVRGFQNDHLGGIKQKRKQLLVSLHKPKSFHRYHVKSAAYTVPVKKHTNENIYCILKKERNIHYNNPGKGNKQKKKMADLKKFTTTLLQLHFSHHR